MDATILVPKERIEIALQLRESHFREFKSAYEGRPGEKTVRPIRDICIDIAQTLVAFANADGGELLVGVEDDGAVTGIGLGDENKIDTLLSAPKTHVHKDTPLPSPRALKMDWSGKTILYFSLPKGTSYVYLTSDGRCLQRKDTDSVPMSSEHIHFSRTEIVSREYDRAFIENADISDLDAVLVNKVAEHISKGMSIEKCLQHLELAEFDGNRIRLRRAALLLFARKPTKWHPRLQVRVLKINGTEIQSAPRYNVTADNEVTDNIISLIESSWDLLRPHLTETRFSKDALFKSQIMYPELACREALVNSIAHRDYSNEGRGVEIRIFTNRLEIVSPGGLLSSIKIEDLRNQKGPHQSRNSLVARVLREVGYMRELGEGMRRIFEVMRSNDLKPPELTTDTNVFVVALHHEYIYSREQKLWLDSFDKFELSREQKTVILLGYNHHVVSPKEIWDAVGIVDTDHYRQLLESLRELGILRRTVDKNRAHYAAAKQRIQVKQVPQFSIDLPGTAPAVARGATEATDDSDYAKIFVVNVAYETTENELLELFSDFGSVVECKIPTNWNTGRARGFAFVEFDKREAALQAIANSGKLMLNGRKLYVQEAELSPSKSAGAKGQTIGNLHGTRKSAPSGRRFAKSVKKPFPK
jgi:ATP-dependent DNA helicase RecG